MTSRPTHSRIFRQFGLLLFSLGGFLLLAFSAAFAASPALDAGSQTPFASPTMYLVTLTPTPTLAPTPTFDMRRLDQPQVGDPLTQLDEGALVYWGVCMACHGDKGQGLTDEWRDSYGEEDRNCWQSKCHASNYPPGGFAFPRVVPSLAGPGRLARFVNARQLYDYNLAKMPWWKPGSLTAEKAWAVTAYLLKLNGTLPEGVVLNAVNASFIAVRYQSKAPQTNVPWNLVLAGALLLAAVGVGAQTLGERKRGGRPSFVLHLHPPSIPSAQAHFRYTLGAGGLAVFFSLILVLTGLLEMYYYVPSPERAAETIQTITFLVPFGGLIRNLHFWSAQGLALVATIHLLRVLLTGAYSRPRRFNYLLGLGLLVVILLLDFTGYVLRWDEGIHWALIAGTNLLASIPIVGAQAVQFVSGGLEPGPAMLIRYYSWHIFGLTLIGGIVMVWHLFRVRRDGGIAAPKTPGLAQSHAGRTAKSPDFAAQSRETLDSEPAKPVATRISRRELLQREVIVMLLAGGILLLISTFLPAPIAQPIDPSLVSLVEPRAPWFFLWVQQLLKLGDPFLLGIAAPLALLGLLSALPYLFPNLSESELGRWFPRRGRAVQILVILLVITVITLTILAR